MDFFLLQVLLAYAVGGAYIAFSLWVSEKISPRIGGMLTSLPSTALVSLFFIGWTQGVPTAVAALPVIPLVFGINSLFLAVFLALQRFSTLKAYLGALLAWSVMVLPLVLYGLNDLWLSVAGALVLLALAMLYFRRIPSTALPKYVSSKKEILLRFLFSGFVVALAVVLSKALGPLWGGLFAAFPAAFSSAILLLSKRYGRGFTASVIKSTPVGSVAAIVFLVAAFYLLPALGLVLGILSAYAICIVAAAILSARNIVKSP